MICGQCDFCAPQRCVAQKFRKASVDDQRHTRDIVKALSNNVSQSTGKLYKEIFPREEVSRTGFEDLLGAMARAGIVEIEETSFEKDGRTIPFRRVSLTLRGENSAERGFENIQLKSERPAASKSRKRDSFRAAQPPDKIVPRKQVAAEPLSPVAAACEDRLRVWRLAEAKRLGLPPFFIFGDKTMRAIAIERPATLNALLVVPGIGSAKADKFGADICAICRE